MKKRSDETQTLRAGCSKAEPKFFAPPQTPFPGPWEGQNLIGWRWSLPLPTNPVWWGSTHAILSYHGNRPTTQSHTHRQDRLQYTALQLARSVTIIFHVHVYFNVFDTTGWAPEAHLPHKHLSVVIYMVVVLWFPHIGATATSSISCSSTIQNGWTFSCWLMQIFLWYWT